MEIIKNLTTEERAKEDNRFTLWDFRRIVNRFPIPDGKSFDPKTFFTEIEF